LRGGASWRGVEEEKEKEMGGEGRGRGLSVYVEGQWRKAQDKSYPQQRPVSVKGWVMREREKRKERREGEVSRKEKVGLIC
jgi:hypothetical protein